MRRKIPSTQALACFEAAARHRSYTRAAEELSMTQSAVSRQISALEQFLGLPVFRRTRHGVALTPAGLQYSRQISRSLQGLEQDTLDLMTGRGRGGGISLAAVPTFATRWLIPRLPALAQLHPGITVHIETRTRSFIFEDSGFDAALFAGTPEQVAHWPGTLAEHLMDENVVPVCSPRFLPDEKLPLHPTRLARLPLLQQSTRPTAWQRWFAALGVTAPGALEGPRYELFSMTVAAAAHGMGIALVPRMLVQEEIDVGQLVLASSALPPVERAYYLVSPANGGDTPALSAFKEWIRERMSSEKAAANQS
ncbi:LysR substrate-binding domain-containing protein [Xylophilus sp. GOD-11R]|uniref:LysR substrate-binding domain-containing protein n=1 Tax=Xylophilus sp. GOD-11R TaxID=3089814 RepID=UPI00298D4BAC|nr:LysR substrate-binding domain-containing protein [Xylophilus sp. GOD-11R]WPB58031.1 LysR substrate-binding domain-containing protein [Xylophilus sp. GOD-11R]